MEWELNIKCVKNGFIVNEHQEGEDDKNIVFEEDENKDEFENMIDLLWYIKDYFGVFYSKHNEKNIIIEIENKK